MYTSLLCTSTFLPKEPQRDRDAFVRETSMLIHLKFESEPDLNSFRTSINERERERERERQRETERDRERQREREREREIKR